MKLGDLCNIKQPEIERIIKVPRTRLSDCKRLIFPEGGGACWMDINYDPILHPIYKLPPLEREGYNFSFTVPFNTVYTDYVETKKGMLINDVIKQISNVYKELWVNSKTIFDTEHFHNLDLSDYYLHTIYLAKDGTGWIDIEIIN